MSVEVLYKRMYGYRIKIAEYIIVYMISLVMNYLSEQDVLNGSHTVWQKMTRKHRDRFLFRGKRN